MVKAAEARSYTLNPKEQELYQALVEKTESGRIHWKMHEVNSYYLDFGGDSALGACKERFHICIARTPSMVHQVHVTIRENGEYLTSFTPIDGHKLFRLAEESCIERSEALAEAIADLEKL